MLLFGILQFSLLACSYYFFHASNLASTLSPPPNPDALHSLRTALRSREKELKSLQSQLASAQESALQWTSQHASDLFKNAHDDIDFLDDRYALEAFPKEPLTIESARLCDEKWTIMLSGSWKCPADPTCAKCKRGSMKHFDDLLHAFRGPGQSSARMAAVSRHFGGGGNSSMIALMAVNYGQLYLFLNWACSCEMLGIDPRKVAMVVPTDEQTAAVLKRLEFFYVSTSWIAALETPISARYTGAANAGGHSAINNVVLLAASELVQAGYEILLHDVDIVWKKDVRPWLASAGRRRDLLGMIAPYWNAKGVINSGFIYVRPTSMSKLLMQSLENVAPLKSNSDQELWNIVIRHLYLRQVSFRILPQSLFYKYSGHREKPPTEATLLYHAVGSSKRFHMKFHKVWYFDNTCHYYDEGADKVSQNVNERKKW